MEQESVMVILGSVAVMSVATLIRNRALRWLSMVIGGGPALLLLALWLSRSGSYERYLLFLIVATMALLYLKMRMQGLSNERIVVVVRVLVRSKVKSAIRWTKDAWIWREQMLRNFLSSLN